MATKVLVTGGSGLLGRAVLRELSKDADWEPLGLAYSRARGNLRKVDLTNREELQDVILEFKPTFIIHCAAERKPDVVEKQEDKTRALNVGSSQNICDLAATIGATVLYTSTDYVFDGTHPPYAENAERNPLNKYGLSKLEGEKVVLKSQKNLIVRLPILYGEVETLDESAVTVLFSALKDTITSKHDHKLRRFPTYVGDVAIVLNKLLKARLKDPSISGIYHWSGDEEMTKYDMVIAMAKVFQLPHDHIEATTDTGSSSAKRPHNAHLDTSKMEALGISQRTPFGDAVKKCLQPYL